MDLANYIAWVDIGMNYTKAVRTTIFPRRYGNMKSSKKLNMNKKKTFLLKFHNAHIYLWWGEIYCSAKYYCMDTRQMQTTSNFVDLVSFGFKIDIKWF